MTSSSEMPPTPDPHEPLSAEEEGELILGPDAIDQLRQKQRPLVKQAGEDAVQALGVAGAATEVPKKRNEAREAAAWQTIAEYIDENVPADYMAEHPELRDRLINMLSNYSVHRMTEAEWLRGLIDPTDPDKKRMRSGRDRLVEDAQKIADEYPLDDESESTEDEPNDPDNPSPRNPIPPSRRPRVKDRLNGAMYAGYEHYSNNKPRYAVGAVALAAASVVGGYFLSKYGLPFGGGGGHHAVAHAGASGGSGSESPQNDTPHPDQPNTDGYHGGEKVYGPDHHFNKTWVEHTPGSSENANQMMHFVQHKHGLTIQLSGEHLGALEHGDHLRANITLNVKGHPETISVPMHNGKLEVTGKLAKALHKGNFDYVEVVRLHDHAETVFSTAQGNGHSFSNKAFHRFEGSFQHSTPQHAAGAGDPAGHKRPSPPPQAPSGPTLVDKANTLLDEATNTPTKLGVAAVGTAATVFGVPAAILLRSHHKDTAQEPLTDDETDEDLTPTKDLTDEMLTSGGFKPEQIQPIVEDINYDIRHRSTDWLQPGESYNYYTTNIRRLIHDVVSDHTTSNMPTSEKAKLERQLLDQYCDGTPEEIYNRLHDIANTPVPRTA